MFRIGLFIMTNIAIMVLISVVFSVFGIQGVLAENGVDLNLSALLIYSAVIGFSGALISLFMSKFMAKRSINVQVITQPQSSDERWLVDAVKRQSKQAGIGMPEVGIFQHASPNAFATGWNRNNSLVAVSTGLLSHMTKAEVEAVLAHEISHVANGDMVTMTLLQGVINTFVVFLSRIIGHIVDRVVFKVERGHGPAYWIVSIVAQVILGILAQMIVMWFSRYREYRADTGAGKLVGNRDMIAALKRLKTTPDDEGLPKEMSALAINGGNIKALFSSHPPLEDRIKALQQPR